MHPAQEPCRRRLAAQEAHAWAEAAFGDPALSARTNVPDSHYLGVYLPFCLPAAVPLLQARQQALFHEVRRRLRAAGGKGGQGQPTPSVPLAGGDAAGGVDGSSVGS
ncbi:hypothetical protein TSOC_005359 [Tetrabaena socialis]|uniref:Uncharacterized protein n=1 Tax=Tetrabaena socialis TaxID=47790 RepID=A0A2J8A6F2_9CHLO|nr:hypothetical protein TSOC_005359 [Tetrabaena socialis]|eukprot:PNH08111.1 hypothetical protein TSOC_005359 [Tetrabaena socialis]